MRTADEFIDNPESAQTDTEEEALFETANLACKQTGLPFVVWISPSMGMSHDVRVKVSRSPKVRISEFVTVTIRPTVRVTGGAMSPSDLALLRKWIDLNRDVIIRYWDGDIESTQEAIAGIQPLR